MHKGKQPVKFSCVEGCADCCIYRDYYPTKEFGKIGVLLLPEEKQRMEELAGQRGISVRIVPRLAVGDREPERVIAYQMMGIRSDGDWCPFLDAGAESPHGGHACSIYGQRPLACAAYPVIDASSKAQLDLHCQFCKKYSQTAASLDGLQGELEALSKIQTKVRADGKKVWRYATATGKEAVYDEGWVLDP